MERMYRGTQNAGRKHKACGVLNAGLNGTCPAGNPVKMIPNQRQRFGNDCENDTRFFLGDKANWLVETQSPDL